jgi:hypothetical protein
MLRVRISRLPFAGERLIYDPVPLETHGPDMFAFADFMHVQCCFIG